jgi:hypothetical protein
LRARPPAPDIPQQPETAPKPLEPARQASKLLARGYIGRAARALYDNKPLALSTKETIDLLREKHPIGPSNPFRGKRLSPG